MVHIALMCSAGMSTSLLVNRMKAAAEADGFECTIQAYPITDIQAAAEGADILLLGPQIRFQLKKVKDQVSIPAEVIDASTYGRMDGEGLLKHVREVLGV